MNLCIAHGHVEAFHYPIWLAMDEAHFIQERESTRMITEAELVRQAVAGLVVEGSRNQFQKLTKQLNVEAKPLPSHPWMQPVLTEEQRTGPRKSRTLSDAILPEGVKPGALKR